MGVFLALWFFLFAPARAAEWAVAPSRDDSAPRWSAEASLPDSFERTQGVVADVWATANDRNTAKRLANHATEAAPRLADELGVGTGPVMQIVIAPTEQQFRSLQPGQTPVWADGTAWPKQGVIFLRAPRLRPGTATPLTTVLDHEIVHVLLGQAFGERDTPHWLQEGVAKVLAREYSSDMTAALATGVLGKNLLSLDQLTGRFPSDALEARLAYAQSADFIAWMRSTYGEDSLAVLVRELVAGRSMDAAMGTVSGQSMKTVESAWLGRLQSRPLPLQILADGGLFIAVGVGIFLVGGLLRTRRTKAKLARWARDEELQDRAMALMRQQWTSGGDLVH